MFELNQFSELYVECVGLSIRYLMSSLFQGNTKLHSSIKVIYNIINTNLFDMIRSKYYIQLTKLKTIQIM